MKRAALAVYIAVALVSGCASHGVQVSQEKASQFKIGVATESDVIASLGQPTGTVSSSDGRLITYTGATAQIRGATFIPIVGLFAGGHDVKASSTTFKFGKDGKLKDVITSNSATSTGMGGAIVEPSLDQPRKVE